MHEVGLLPYISGLHHKDNATQSAQAAVSSHCSWNPNRGPLQTFLRAGPLMPVVNGQNHGKIQVTQYASCIHRLWKGSSCSLPTKPSLHAAIEARIDCLLVILSQSVTDRTRWAIFSPSSHLHQFSDIIIHHRRLSRTMSYGHGAFGAPRNRVTDWAPTPISTSFGAEEIGWQALGPAIACTILATTVVVLRWYTRYRLAQCTGVDDIVILFSMVCAHGKPLNRPRLTNYSRHSHGVCAP